MLGFTPLASAPLADDGSVASLSAVSILTGSPSVDSSTLTQLHSIVPVVLTAGNPEISSSQVTQDHDLAGQTLTALPYILGVATIVSQNHSLTPAIITTESPENDTVTLLEYLASNYNRKNVALVHPIQSRLASVA